MKRASRGVTSATAGIAHSPSYLELVRLVGDLPESQLAEIERLNATVAEIEQAVAFASGESDVMGDARIRLSGRAAEVYRIITTNDVADDER